MSQVKKSVGKVGVRNVSAGHSVKKAAASAGKKTPHTSKHRTAIKPRAKAAHSAPNVKIDIRELDPIRKCGSGTSVKVLLRVIERAGGMSVNHLVFFDKYGWYCEHGPACHAVGYAKKSMKRRAGA